VLLFAKNVLQFPLNCRIRFIRIDGREMHVGADYNVVKDKSIDEPILRLIDDAKAYIADQLREFTHQDRESGRFIETPEYPEFPWYEGIINAVAHRDWAATGQFIKVSMYDDRLEIESPGRFPDIVTADNISYTRFSRNKRISRVMTEFEWVRELNEGVKKIYSDMADAGLPAPEYIEGPNTVRLILRNNIDERMPRRNKASDKPSSEALNDALPKDIRDQLDDIEMSIVKTIYDKGTVTRAELEAATNKSTSTVSRRIKRLLDKGIIIAVGDPHNPNRQYKMK
jgi:ATP-dependent DNA helicase RecG